MPHFHLKTFSRCRRLMAPAAFLALGILSGCSGEADSLYPTDKGHFWQYRTTTMVLDEARDQKMLVTSLGEVQLENRRFLAQRVQQDHVRLLKADDGGIFRVGSRHGREPFKPDEPPVLIAPPGNLGDFSEQEVRSTLQVIESRTFAREDKLRPRRFSVKLALSLAPERETVTVPAGTFADCVVMEARGTRFVPADRGNATAEVNVVERSWFAPGVGLVKVDREERSDSVFLKTGHFTQVLEAFR